MLTAEDVFILCFGSHARYLPPMATPNIWSDLSPEMRNTWFDFAPLAQNGYHTGEQLYELFWGVSKGNTGNSYPHWHELADMVPFMAPQLQQSWNSFAEVLLQ